ncbi:glycosyltransferase family protein [Spirosoma areae]
MKIVFFCGSLEPGRDGVGDYTRKLAGELIRQNHQAAIIALNDKYLQNIVEESIQVDGTQEITTLRLSHQLSWEARRIKIIEFIEYISPHWLSLQYVPYSFHSKGLPFNLVIQLKKLGKNYLWHIMFHETWVGIKSQSPITHNFYKFFQKKIAKFLTLSLTPKSVSTSNRLYQLVLEHIGIKAHILTLFSNISVTQIDSEFVAYTYESLGIKENELNKYLFVGVFGSIHSTSDLENIIYNEIISAREYNKKIIVLGFGRIRNVDGLLQLKELFKDKIDVFYLGELPEYHVSSLLQILDKGVSCTPEEYISKSGVYAAMRLHNLQVLSTSSMHIPKYEIEIKKFNEYLKSREYYKWSVVHTAKEFYEDLSLYSHI